MVEHKHHIIQRYKCKLLGINCDHPDNIVFVPRETHARIHWGYFSNDISPLLECCTPPKWILDNIELGNAYDAGAANLITEQYESNYSVNGENNPNFKTGFFVGRLDDPLIYKKTDKVRNAIRHKKNLNRGRSRMKARYYLSVNNIEKAKYWFDEWIKAIESQPESTKGKFKKKMPVWSVWKNSQNFERK
jgi:hypothetical protein